MNKMYLAIGGIAVVALLGIVFFINASKSTLPPQDTNQPTESSADSMQESNEFTGNLGDLFSRNKNLMCTYSWNDGTTSSNGTVYISGERMYADMATTVNGTVQDGKMIRDNESVYIWSSNQSQGYKMKIEDTQMPDNAMEEDSQSDETQTSMRMFEEEQAKYNCTDWSANASVFVPPSNIEFVDFGAQMQQLQEAQMMEKDEQDVDCSICDQVPSGDAQTQCRQSLGC